MNLQELVFSHLNGNTFLIILKKQNTLFQILDFEEYLNESSNQYVILIYIS